MCGIAGIISANTQLISKERIQSAIHCLSHRGPDGDNTWINEEHTVSLGHRRLRIIDLSSEAGQPLFLLNRYHIIHNGELYNYIEIKKQLSQKGYVFTTQSDTEVIAAAYDCYGKDCLSRFDGMFAFAIWDAKEKKLFAARDRFGEKPFFFYYDDEQLAFASEMKALWGTAKKEVNSAMVYNFLTIGYTGNPADPGETFYQNIRKLPAASFLTYHLPSHTLEIEKYWQVYPGVKAIAEDEAIEKFRHLFSESIRKRLRSDVAIGTSLSGGLDSSSIVAFCHREMADQYSHKCFTASFKGFEKDESEQAAAVAGQFGLAHHVVEIDEGEIPGLMERVMRRQEEPFSSASVLAQYKLYQSARENGVTVLLDGQGADEVMAGYHQYYKWYWQELYRAKKLNKSREMQLAREIGVREPFGLKNKAAALLPEFAAGLLQSRKSRQAFTRPDLDRDFAFSNKRNLYYATPAAFDLNGVLYFNTFVNGLEELLRLADRNSMAHAVEVRLPFLNHELVEFLFSLPPGLKIHKGWTKWLLRKTVADLLPEQITWRKDKVGFEPPQKSWMENKLVQEAIHEGKKKLAAHHILKASAVEKKIKPHNSYAADGWDWKYWSASFLFD
jgi:asparagine synthase (glutamine-hydrolysing)